MLNYQDLYLSKPSKKSILSDSELILIIEKYLPVDLIKNQDLFQTIKNQKKFTLNGIELASNFIYETGIDKSPGLLLDRMQSKIYHLVCRIAMLMIRVRVNSIKWQLIKYRNKRTKLLQWEKELLNAKELIKNIDLPRELIYTPLYNLNASIDYEIGSVQSSLSNKLMWNSLKRSLSKIFITKQKIPKKKEEKMTDPIKSFQSRFSKEQKAAIIGNLIIIAKSDGGMDDYESNLLEKFAKFIGLSMEDQIITDQISGGRKLMSSRLDSMSQKNKEWFVVAAYEMGICNGISDDEQINVMLNIFQDIGISEENFVNIIEKSKQIYKRFG